MIYRVLYTEEAARQIRKLDGAVRRRIQKAVESLRARPESGKRLTGLLSDRWSWRCGNWRILYKIRGRELLIVILTVGHRREVYRP